MTYLTSDESLFNVIEFLNSNSKNRSLSSSIEKSSNLSFSKYDALSKKDFEEKKILSFLERDDEILNLINKKN